MAISPVYSTFFTLGQKVPQGNFRLWMASVETVANAAETASAANSATLASLSATVTANGSAITANASAIATINDFLAGVEANATADQTGAEIVALLNAELGSTAWQSGGGSGGATNLSFTRDATTLTVASSTGISAVLPKATDTLAGLARKATTAEVLQAVADAYLTGDHLAAALAPVTLTYAASQAIDFKGGFNQRVVLAGATTTLQLPTNPVPGRWINLDVIQDAAGSRVLGFATGYQFPNKTAPTITATANAKTKLSIYCEDATNFVVIANLDIGAPA